jgi:hypothetical protein
MFSEISREDNLFSSQTNDSNFLNLPTMNERVQLLSSPSGRFYKRLDISDNKNTNAFINEISTNFENSTAANTDSTKTPENKATALK